MSGVRRYLAAILSATVLATLSAGCGEDVEVEVFELEETGSIGPGDVRDAGHAGLAYDPFIVEAALMGTVEAEVTTEDFTPMLKLVEVSTGAVLDEWTAEYSDDDAMMYTIAADGEYEVRVYALDEGTGEYTVRISVVP